MTPVEHTDEYQDKHLIQGNSNLQSNGSQQGRAQGADPNLLSSIITQYGVQVVQDNQCKDEGQIKANKKTFVSKQPVGQYFKRQLHKVFCCSAQPLTPHAYYQQYTEDKTGAADESSSSQDSCRQQQDLLIGPIRDSDKGKKTLVLDLDETLVHSTFKPVPNPDYILPVEIEGKCVFVYVIKRPWVDYFMNQLSSRFEIVVFTASVAKYADPLLNMLDANKNDIRYRLFREACALVSGNYVKDLKQLGRDMSQVIIVDNSPLSYMLQEENAVPVGTFIDDMDDSELLQLLPILFELEQQKDVRNCLGANYEKFRMSLSAQVSQQSETSQVQQSASATANGQTGPLVRI